MDTFGYGLVTVFTLISLVYYIIFEGMIFRTQWNILMKLWTLCLLGILQSSLSLILLLEEHVTFSQQTTKIITIWSPVAIGGVTFSIAFFAVVMILCGAMSYYPVKTVKLSIIAATLSFIAYISLILLGSHDDDTKNQIGNTLDLIAWIIFDIAWCSVFCLMYFERLSFTKARYRRLLKLSTIASIITSISIIYYGDLSKIILGFLVITSTTITCKYIGSHQCFQRKIKMLGTTKEVVAVTSLTPCTAADLFQFPAHSRKQSIETSHSIFTLNNAKTPESISKSTSVRPFKEYSNREQKSPIHRALSLSTSSPLSHLMEDSEHSFELLPPKQVLFDIQESKYEDEEECADDNGVIMKTIIEEDVADDLNDNNVNVLTKSDFDD